jgi:hypothetical protein
MIRHFQLNLAIFNRFFYHFQLDFAIHDCKPPFSIGFRHFQL